MSNCHSGHWRPTCSGPSEVCKALGMNRTAVWSPIFSCTLDKTPTRPFFSPMDNLHSTSSCLLKTYTTYTQICTHKHTCIYTHTWTLSQTTRGFGAMRAQAAVSSQAALSQKAWATDTDKCYRRSCLSPQIPMWKPNSQYDSVKGSGLWEVIRPQGQSPQKWDWFYYKRDPRELPCPSVMWGHPSVNWELTLTRHQICRHLDLGLPQLQTIRNKFLLFISLPVHSGVTAWMD